MRRQTEAMSFIKMRSGFFFLLIGVLFLGFLYLIRPFFYPIFWAAIMAILFYPVYSGLNRVLKLPSMSAILSMLIALVIIFVPLSIIVTLIFHQSVAVYESITNGHWSFNIEGIASWLDNTPLKPYIENIRDDS